MACLYSNILGPFYLVNPTHWLLPTVLTMNFKMSEIIFKVLLPIAKWHSFIKTKISKEKRF